MDLNRYLPDLRESGLLIVAAAYGLLIVLNVATLVPGPVKVLDELNPSPLAPVLAIIVFDTPWTLAGLAGLVMLLGAVLFTTPVNQRLKLSLFFLCWSFSVAVIAGALWDTYYDETGFVGAGASAIAIAGQAIICTVSAFGILRLIRKDTRDLGRMSSYWWYSSLVIYATMILTTIWFVVFLQSIFVPTELYNWRVHEFAFFIAIAGTVLFEGATWSTGGPQVDKMLVNFHFDDLNDRFDGRLPKLKVSFSQLPQGDSGDFDPATSSVLLPLSLNHQDYRKVGNELDACLLHGMVHAYLFLEGGAWKHGDPATRERFNSLAGRVGASPEP